MSIKNRIKELSERRGMSLAELERKLNFGNGTIAKWDRRSPSSDKLTEVANYLNVSTDYLLCRPEAEKNIDADLDEALDNAHSFDGKPISDRDRKVLKGMLREYFQE